MKPKYLVINKQTKRAQEVCYLAENLPQVEEVIAEQVRPGTLVYVYELKRVNRTWSSG